jgi:hypothetical protein
MAAGATQPQPVTLAGAEETYLGEPQSFGVPNLNEHVIRELSARYQNVVVLITYDPGQVIDNGKLANVLTSAAGQALATVKTTLPGEKPGNWAKRSVHSV